MSEELTALDAKYNAHPTAVLLSGMLVIAVQAEVPFVHAMSWEERLRVAKICAQHIAEKGDILLFKSSKKGETAQAFAKLAIGVAIASFAIGGVRLFGLHYLSCRKCAFVHLTEQRLSADARCRACGYDLNHPAPEEGGSDGL